MKHVRYLGVAALSALALCTAESAWSDEPLTKIQFKDIGAITEWRAAASNIVYVKDRKDQWYRADLVEACMTLNTKNGVNFLTESDIEDPGVKVSRVVVDHHMCTVYGLTKVDGPPATTFTPGSK